ncbi:MAG: hypothetical protein LAP87_17735, partial [Acidobacteriia bacterium]|nr:hypothetical protein [Terriglobia bacterium]
MRQLIAIGILLSSAALGQQSSCSNATITLSADVVLSGSVNLSWVNCTVHGAGFKVVNNGTGSITITGSTIDHLGDAANFAVQLVTSGTYHGSIDIEHGTFDACGPVGNLKANTIVAGDANLQVLYNTWKNTPAGAGNLSIQSAAVTTGSQNIKWNAFDSVVGCRFSACGSADGYTADGSANGATFRYNYFGNNFSGSGFAVFDHNFVRNTVGDVGGTIFTLDSSSPASYLYALLDAPPGGSSTLSDNPHFFTGRQSGDHYIAESVEDITHDSGELFSAVAPGHTTQTNHLVLPSHTGNSTMELVAGGVGNNGTWDHCTWWGGAPLGGPFGAADIDETFAGATGSFSLQNSILWNPDGVRPFPKVAAFSFAGLGATAWRNTNVCTVCDYNNGWHFTAAVQSPCVDCANSGNGYNGKWSATPGEHDRNVDPQFVDYKRNIALFDTKYLGHAPGPAWVANHAYAVGDVVSVADANLWWGLPINYRCTASHTSAAALEPGIGSGNWRADWQLASLYDIAVNLPAGTAYPDGTILDALQQWIYRGYAPTNPALRGAASDGTDIGAVPLGSPVTTDANGRVTNVPAGISTILGPMTAMGVNPWPWADTAQIAWAQRYGGWQGTIPAPGGTFVDNWRTPDPPATPGTISVTNGSGTVTGSG